VGRSKLAIAFPLDGVGCTGCVKDLPKSRSGKFRFVIRGLP
jgi:hypothetical protein